MKPLPEDDLKAIPKCKLGDCEVKLSEEALTRLQTEVDWSAADAHDRANAVLRDLALAYVEGYRSGGNKELAVYRDKKRPNFIAEEFAELLENSPYLPDYIGELHDYLLDYPAVSPPGLTDFFYWTKNEFGLKPTLRLNHVALYRRDDKPGHAVIASKQLYGTHYFHTGLELRYLSPGEPPSTKKGFYFLTLNRGRSDGLEGFTGLVVRRSVRNRTRDGQRKYLELTKRNLEQAYKASR